MNKTISSWFSLSLLELFVTSDKYTNQQKGRVSVHVVITQTFGKWYDDSVLTPGPALHHWPTGQPRWLTSLLSAGPRARSYRLFGAMFPTASRNLGLVMVFTLSFLDSRDRTHWVCSSSAERSFTTVTLGPGCLHLISWRHVLSCIYLFAITEPRITPGDSDPVLQQSQLVPGQTR